MPLLTFVKGGIEDLKPAKSPSNKGGVEQNLSDKEIGVIDILEQSIYDISPQLLALLLKDKTTRTNIRWACDEYKHYGKSYEAAQEILPEQITGKHTKVIQPRIAKSKSQQRDRTKEFAEVFTPSWICNEMINACDEEWFGVQNVFNFEENKSWKVNPAPILFSNEKKRTWQDYVSSKRLEITCGEGPYLVSRYDTTTGEKLSIGNRIGILDRKLRVVNENTTNAEDWYYWAKRAFESTYGYEYQGDNLLLARENLLWTFIEYYQNRFKQSPAIEQLLEIANIIAWNIWQMDGLNNTTPYALEDDDQPDLFSSFSKKVPVLSKIMDWRSKKSFYFNKKGEYRMKFSVVIGNPAYQEMNDKNKMSRSIYPDFVKSAKTFGNIVSFIMPARWMSGESGPYRETQGFIDDILEGNHIKRFHLFPNSGDLFQNVDIKGGVCYFVWDKNYSKDEVNYVLCENGQKNESKISFRVAENIIIRFPELIEILKKSRNHQRDSMKKQVSSRNPFGFVSDLFTKNNEGVSRISETKQSDDDYLIHGLLGGKRVIRYIPNFELKKNIEGALAYKIFVPRANGSGTFGEVFSTPMIGTPMMICTDTFLQIGEFDNRLEAENLLKYIKTKYCRAMIGIKKTAVFNYKDCFTYVPLQDFTDKSDIDWTQSISNIDKQLYNKYGLSAEEIDFIETHVKPME